MLQSNMYYDFSLKNEDIWAWEMHKLWYIPTMLYKKTIKRNELALIYQLHKAQNYTAEQKKKKM